MPKGVSEERQWDHEWARAGKVVVMTMAARSASRQNGSRAESQK